MSVLSKFFNWPTVKKKDIQEAAKQREKERADFLYSIRDSVFVLETGVFDETNIQINEEGRHTRAFIPLEKKTLNADDLIRELRVLLDFNDVDLIVKWFLKRGEENKPTTGLLGSNKNRGYRIIKQ